MYLHTITQVIYVIHTPCSSCTSHVVLYYIAMCIKKLKLKNQEQNMAWLTVTQCSLTGFNTEAIWPHVKAAFPGHHFDSSLHVAWGRKDWRQGQNQGTSRTRRSHGNSPAKQVSGTRSPFPCALRSQLPTRGGSPGGGTKCHEYPALHLESSVSRVNWGHLVPSQGAEGFWKVQAI